MEWTGMCRQFIREFADLNTPIFMYDKDGEYVVRTLEQVWQKIMYNLLLELLTDDISIGWF